MRSKLLSHLSICAAVAAVAILGLAHSTALAHPGGLSSKDACHRDAAAGERHWHLPGTRDRGGPCVRRDGRTVKAKDPAAPATTATVTVPSDVYTGLVAERDSLREKLAASERKADTWRDAHENLRRTLRAAEAARDRAIGNAAESRRRAELATTRERQAREDADAAEARARGAGPAVSPRCVRGVNAALDAGWRFSSNEKAALRRACLQ